MITLYLAGAIRDDHPEDISWREDLITRLTPVQGVSILNPVGNKTYNLMDGEWQVAGTPVTSHGIVTQDLWCVQRADIIVANCTALSTGYPMIGTMIELGVAVGLGGKLIYTVIDPEFTGHENKEMFALHPFLKEISSEVFGTLPEMAFFLTSHLHSLGGYRPRFGGYRGGI